MKTITSGKEWRTLREQGELVTLPSGNVARLRPVALVELIHRGRVPNHLFKFTHDMMAGDLGAVPAEERIEQLKSYSQLSEIICKSAFIEPKIVDEVQDDNEITYFDLDEDDASFVVAWTREPQLSLEKFREEEKESVDSV